MARIKVRFSINKGRHGAPLAKLGKIAEQAERLLRSLAADCNIESRVGEWVAVNFTNSSVEYDAEFLADVNPGAAQVFSRSLEYLADYDPSAEGLNGTVSAATALEYARIGTLIDPDEVIGLGIYGRGDAPKWRQISYARATAIRRELETPLPTYGALQGILHAWFKEAREPSFQLRELATGNLVRVHYSPALYSDVARAVQEKTTMLVVSGMMAMDRTTRQAIDMRAEKINRIQMLSSAEFEALFGSAPDFEGDFGEDAYVGDAA